MSEGLFGKIFGKGKNKESGSVGGEVVEAVAARAVGELGKAMTLKFKDVRALSETEDKNKISIEDNMLYNLINQCTDGELDKKIQGTKKAVGEISTLTIPKDTLLKFREVMKDQDLTKALQMSGSVAQIASLGVLIVAVGMLKKTNDQLGDVSNSVSRIADYQETEYDATAGRVLTQIKRITKFQSESLRDRDVRNNELRTLRDQEDKCIDLLLQANSMIKKDMAKEQKSFKNYVDNTADIEKWCQYQQLLIRLLKQISELTYSFNLGAVSRENSYQNYEENLRPIVKVRKELRDWHLKNMGYYSVDLKEKKYRRAGSVFDAAKRIPLGALANKISENTISDDMIGFIENQTQENNQDPKAASVNQFEEDVKIVVEDGKLYYVSKI